MQKQKCSSGNELQNLDNLNDTRDQKLTNIAEYLENYIKKPRIKLLSSH